MYRHDHWMRRFVLPFIPRFVSPNHVTVLRFISIPFVAWFLYQENYAVGLPLFVVSAFTDAVDGSLARVRKQVTRWGTFYDPVADKLLIGSAVILVVASHISTWFAAIILLMELLIGLGGYVYRREGKMQSANAWGKAKMFVQFCGITLLLAGVATNAAVLIPFASIVLTVAIFLAVISLFTYGL